MRTKLVPLLVLCFALSISHVAFAQYTGGSGDGYAMGTSQEDSSLPVELSTFTAAISGDSVILKWRTETEINNVGFTIYRSESAGGDARSSGKYTEISFVKGAGNTAMPTDYKFTDVNVEPGKTYFYYLEDIDILGEKNKTEIVKVVVPLAKPALIPKEFRLLQSYPNPFNPETWIPYQLAEDSEVTVRIYNVSGQLVKTLSLGVKEAGYYITKNEAAYWDGKDELGEKVASGVYWYTFGGFEDTRRMVIVK